MTSVRRAGCARRVSRAFQQVKEERQFHRNRMSAPDLAAIVVPPAPHLPIVHVHEYLRMLPAGPRIGKSGSTLVTNNGRSVASSAAGAAAAGANRSPLAR